MVPGTGPSRFLGDSTRHRKMSHRCETERCAMAVGATASPDLPPYDPDRILGAPFPERVRLVLRTWAAQVQPTPKSVMALYWTKYLFVYIGGWAIFQTLNAHYPGAPAPRAGASTGAARPRARERWVRCERTSSGRGGGATSRMMPQTRGRRSHP